jgi:hypothetical protein
VIPASRTTFAHNMTLSLMIVPKYVSGTLHADATTPTPAWLPLTGRRFQAFSLLLNVAAIGARQPRCRAACQTIESDR